MVGCVKRGGHGWRVVVAWMACVAALWPFAARAAAVSGVAPPPGAFAFHGTVSSDGLVVIHTYARPARFAAQILALAQADLAHPIADTLGFMLEKRVDIYVYNSRRDFLAGAQPGDASETGAFAIPAQNAVFLPVEGADANEAQDYLPHELTHIVFHQNEDVGVYGGTIFPHWLDEGNAAYDQLPDSAEVQQYAGALQAAERNHTLLDLFTQFNATYPADPGANFLAYAEARSFVGYLISTYGPAAYHRFLRVAHDGDLILAAATAFGADLRLLQSRWLVSLGQPATARDLGYMPRLDAPTPFVMGISPAITAAVHPIPLAQSNVVMNLFADGLLWLLVELVMIAVVEVILRATQPPGSLARRPWRPRWEHLGVAVIAPVVLLSGIAWARYGDGQWSHAAFVAAVTAFALLTIMLAANWGALLRGRVTTSRLVGLLTAALLMALAFAQARPLAWQQAQIYAQHGAYALALQAAQDAGQPAMTLAQLHEAWAVTAQSAGDWRAATQQFQDAQALLSPTDATARDLQGRLNQVTLAWGRGLTTAHDYADALQVYAAALSQIRCDAECQALLAAAEAQTYLVWGDAQLLAGDAAGALAHYEIVARQFGASSAAIPARLALREIPAARMLQAALAAGTKGNTRAMNARLRSLAHVAPGTAAAGEVNEMPQPARGRVINRSGASETGQRVYFMAFAQKSDAHAYHYERVLFTVAATIGPRGAISALLPAGYWYAVFWEDPRRPQSFNAPPGGTGVFFVRPLTPMGLGTFVGA